MRKLTKTYSSLLFSLLFIGMIACGPKKVQNETAGKSDQQEIAYDSTKIQIDMAKVDSMLLLYPDSNDQYIIGKDDQSVIAETMLTAVYDTAWNDKGIMVKMVAPDYTMVVKYKGQNSDENKWLMMWKEGGRAKYKDKWFLLDEEYKKTLFPILDSYKK